MSSFFRKKVDPVTAHSAPAPEPDAVQLAELEVANNGKSFWQRVWPVMACGAGLFSDGYVNNVIGSVSTMLGQIYGKEYTQSAAKRNVSSIAFAGTVVGQLVFGYTSDKWSRKNSLLVSTVILTLFTALAAGSYGAGGSTQGLFAALTAWRFFVGLGIGGEYPAGSVACSEATGELNSGSRNRWFIFFTNCAIDWGFVIGAFVPYLLVVICGEGHLRAAWRISLGLGVVPPLVLFFLRLKLKEPEEFKRESMRNVRTPYWLALKFYGPRLLAISLIWFIYDFSAYGFGIYSSTIVNTIIPNGSLAQSFGWNTVINLFYIPGCMLGGPVSDWVGPRYALVIGITLQAIVGYIMAALYDRLAQPSMIGAFAVVYGIFLSLGEFGPGDNIGLLASKTSSTSIRGTYYGIAAAIGKVGAFVGTYIFPFIEDAGKTDTQSAQYPFWVSSSLAIFAGIIALTCLPNVGQDTIAREDIRFREYLERNGWDTSRMGLVEYDRERTSAEMAHADDARKEKM